MSGSLCVAAALSAANERRKNMSRSRLVICIAVFAAVCFSSVAPAKELGGTYTPEQVKGACDKVGGEYFSQGQTGTYGCENHKNGSMVLCNKAQKCEGFTPTRTRNQNLKIIRDLKLNAAVKK
jgi:hypothetical protein